MRDCAYTRSGLVSDEEKAFLENYNADAYPKPSVTADIVTLTLDEEDHLCVLLIRRKGFPYKGKWALPGGFLAVDKESVTETARRELFEETGVENAALKQLYTFSDPGRDPRMHVVSVAYTALVPKCKLQARAGDDAEAAMVFRIAYDIDGMTFRSGSLIVTESNLAFDHAKILRMAIKRLRGRISYEPDAFWLLRDRHEFAISELKAIYECIRNEKMDVGNFRKVFFRDFLNTGRVVALEKKRAGKKKPASLYDYIENLQDED